MAGLKAKTVEGTEAVFVENPVKTTASKCLWDWAVMPTDWMDPVILNQ
jgi:hypothetical protein